MLTHFPRAPHISVGIPAELTALVSVKGWLDGVSAYVAAGSVVYLLVKSSATPNGTTVLATFDDPDRRWVVFSGSGGGSGAASGLSAIGTALAAARGFCKNLGTAFVSSDCTNGPTDPVDYSRTAGVTVDSVSSCIVAAGTTYGPSNSISPIGPANSGAPNFSPLYPEITSDILRYTWAVGMRGRFDVNSGASALAYASLVMWGDNGKKVAIGVHKTLGIDKLSLFVLNGTSLVGNPESVDMPTVEGGGNLDFFMISDTITVRGYVMDTRTGLAPTQVIEMQDTFTDWPEISGSVGLQTVSTTDRAFTYVDYFWGTAALQ
jgi:hypothetical protein